MASGADASISRRLLPNNDGLPGTGGIFGRLLQRTKSTKGSKRSRRSSLLPSSNSNEADGTTLNRVAETASHRLEETTPTSPAAQQQHPATQLNARSIAQPQPQRATEDDFQLAAQAPPAATSTALEMQTPAQQPRLKKRASIRDRLRGAWQKPATTTLPALQEEAKPRFVYTPKHAAADFSRLAISPTSPPLLRQRQHRISTSVEARPALSPRQEVDTGALAAKPQRPQPPQLQTLQENEAAAPVARKESRSRRHNKTVTTDENISRGRVRSSPPRNSLTLVENPWEASQPLVDSQPIADQKPRNRSDDSPPSDYEAFIARAAAEDRAHREQVWRTISQRSAVLKPNPHLQYASARSSADISAGSTAVAGNKTSAGDGSRSSGSRRESGQYYTIGRGSSDEQQFRRSHSKRASWAPSYDASGGDVEKSLEKKTPRQHQQQQPIVLGVDENFRPSSRMVEQQQQQQPMRTLRRQGSISQRIAEYIRPAREDITEKYEQPVRRPSSRAGMRRSGSQAHHPIETLAE